MENQPETPEVGNSPVIDEVEALTCPQCGSENLRYDGEVYDDEEHMGSGFACRECGLRFTEQEAGDGTW